MIKNYITVETIEEAFLDNKDIMLYMLEGYELILRFKEGIYYIVNACKDIVRVATTSFKEFLYNIDFDSVVDYKLF